MQALHQVTGWPVDNVAALVIRPGHDLESIGDLTHEYRLASISKPLMAWATLVAVEEGIVALDGAPRHVEVQPGCTLRHLLSHAGGYAFDGAAPISPPERRRIYSNTGIELAATEVAAAAGMPFEQYLREAVFEPLGMAATELRGSPAHGVRGTAADLGTFAAELLRPALLAPTTTADAFRPQYPDLAGIVPDVGRFTPCPWGLGVEIHGAKHPHWMGRTNSPETFGHFGGSGTMMWVDPVADCALVALTDRPTDGWMTDALRLWPELSDAVLAEIAGVADVAGAAP
ncbi:MAG: serine hydrolase domain-containing protein [Ilumatobacteraceae bacterium]